MTAPDWLRDVLEWRATTPKQRRFCEQHFGRPFAPNIADANSQTSVKIAGVAYERLGINREAKTKLNDDEPGDAKANYSTGARLETLISNDLRHELDKLGRTQWTVERGRSAAHYRQFAHLRDLQALFRAHPTLRSTVGQDYQVKTDVC